MATTYNYLLSNFLATPSLDDVRLRIYEKSGKLKYTIDPNIAYFFTKSNIVIIKIEDRNDIQLNFIDSNTAYQALTKLNTAKKDITNIEKAPFTTVSIDSGTSIMYFNSGLTNSQILNLSYLDKSGFTDVRFDSGTSMLIFNESTSPIYIDLISLKS
jgi:hypothetical protein